jgi:hypothetical protein
MTLYGPGIAFGAPSSGSVVLTRSALGPGGREHVGLRQLERDLVIAGQPGLVDDGPSDELHERIRQLRHREAFGRHMNHAVRRQAQLHRAGLSGAANRHAFLRVAADLNRIGTIGVVGGVGRCLSRRRLQLRSVFPHDERQNLLLFLLVVQGQLPPFREQ